MFLNVFLQKELQNLEDAGDEIMLIEDDTAPIPYPFFSFIPVKCFLNILHEQIELYLKLCFV